MAVSDYFYYGSRIGDTFTGQTPTLTTYTTLASDEIEVRSATPAFLLPGTNPLDFDKNSILLASDQIIARGNAGFQFKINITGPPPPAPAASPVSAIDDDGAGSAVASALTIPDASSRPNTASSVPAPPSRIDLGSGLIAGLVQLLEEPDGLRALALSKAVDDVVDEFELDDDLLDQLVARLPG